MQFTDVQIVSKGPGIERVLDSDLRKFLGKRQYARWLRWYREQKDEYEAYLVEQFLLGETNHIRARANISSRPGKDNQSTW